MCARVCVCLHIHVWLGVDSHRAQQLSGNSLFLLQACTSSHPRFLDVSIFTPDVAVCQCALPSCPSARIPEWPWTAEERAQHPASRPRGVFSCRGWCGCDFHDDHPYTLSKHVDLWVSALNPAPLSDGFTCQGHRQKAFIQWLTSFNTKWGHACILSHFSGVWHFATLWTVACKAPLSVGCSGQEYWSGLPWPPPGALPNLGTEPFSLRSSALAGGFFTTRATWEAHKRGEGPKEARHSGLASSSPLGTGPPKLCYPWAGNQLGSEPGKFAGGAASPEPPPPTCRVSW